jgi:hypothetical protein
VLISRSSRELNNTEPDQALYCTYCWLKDTLFCTFFSLDPSSKNFLMDFLFATGRKKYRIGEYSTKSIALLWIRTIIISTEEPEPTEAATFFVEPEPKLDAGPAPVCLDCHSHFNNLNQKEPDVKTASIFLITLSG